MPSSFDKGRIITMINNGMSYRDVAEQLGISKSTVCRTVRNWRNDHQLERRAGSGRRRISTHLDDEQVQTFPQERPFTTAGQIMRELNFPASVWTVRRRLREIGLRSRVAARKPRLTPLHREIRMGFALQYVAQDEEFWRQIVFSDEKVFQSCPNGRLKVYRPRNSRFEEPYVQTIQRSGRFSVNMWAWISAASPGVMIHVEERLTSDVYIRVLENIMLPSVQAVNPNWNFIFQHDNCAVHTARRVVEWCENHNINVLDWPSCSPDLNPIENMWGILIKFLQRPEVVFHNRDELLAAITEAWHSLPQNYHVNLCLSMRNRLNKVIDANGGFTKY
jgi:transposase